MKNSIRLLSKFYNNYQFISLYISLVSLLLIPAGLLFSRALLSIGFIAFIANWFLESDYKLKWQLIKQYKLESIICLIFFFHLVGMLHTSNIEAGLKDLKIKLPLLFPIFLFSSYKLMKVIEPSIFIWLFAISTIVATLIGFIRFEYFIEFQTVEDLRNISFMGQNIMLSLFVNFSIFIFYDQLQFLRRKSSVYIRIVLLICIIWLIIFLYVLNSLTGHLTFCLLVLFSIFNILKTYKRNYIIGLLIIMGLSGLSILIYINQLINNFYSVENINLQNLEKYTSNGRIYENKINSLRTENGHYIDIYVCKEELENEWKKQSKLSLTGRDNKDQLLSETLIRYLSSKGLRKDSAGLNQLSQSDIQFIENGCANYKYTSKYSIESRIYNIIWQFNTYQKTGNASAQSISQRMEFLKSAVYIIKHHFWFGVGSGDVMDTFHKTLEEISPQLDARFRNRVHNQYIVEFVALGVFGFIAFITIIFYPVFKYKIWKHYLFSIFYLIILISFLTDNPLETQLGVGFFSFFYCLLILKLYKENATKKSFSLASNLNNYAA